jgi:uncharacterized protein YjiS (DUF1127 family)
MVGSDKRTGTVDRVVAWWRNMLAARAQLAELDNCGAELGHIARDMGVTRSELYTIAAKRPDAADPLNLRLEALDLDRAEMLRTDPSVLRDLERVCTVCGEKRRCERDWLRHPDDEAWRAYCPNAMTLQALDAQSAAAGSSAGLR